MCVLAFVLSAIIDNLTATIVLITILRKLVPENKDRIWFAGLIIIAANAGGAWSPIGDVTTTMLWMQDKVTAVMLIKTLLLPSIVCMIIPTVIATRLPIFRGEIEAADAYGLSGWHKFRRIIWPTMLRLAWPSYTNEAIFLFHSTTLVFFSGFPAWQQRGDALYYANYFADKTFNPFVPYPILAGYFIVLTLIILALFGAINRRLNRHLPSAQRFGPPT